MEPQPVLAQAVPVGTKVVTEAPHHHRDKVLARADVFLEAAGAGGGAESEALFCSATL